MNNGDPALSALAQEFRDLRLVRGHFGDGQWNDAVDAAGGRKQKLMSELDKRLGDGTHRKAEVVALMGRPDAIAARGTPLFGQSYRGSDPRVTEVLVYHWRGGHDYLFFASDGAHALSTGWWGAGD